LNQALGEAQLLSLQNALREAEPAVSFRPALLVSLADLSNELPGGTPQDPFDGQPLRYKKLPARGYAIYSVGPDRTDDGGEAKGPDGKTPLDVVMTIAR